MLVVDIFRSLMLFVGLDAHQGLKLAMEVFDQIAAFEESFSLILMSEMTHAYEDLTCVRDQFEFFVLFLNYRRVLVSVSDRLC